MPKTPNPQLVEIIKELRREGLNSIEIAERLTISLKQVNFIMSKFSERFDEEFINNK